jgi:hypothetical protein
LTPRILALEKERGVRDVDFQSVDLLASDQGV